MAVGIMMFVSTVTSTQVSDANNSLAPVSTSTPLVVASTMVDSANQKTTEEFVREYFTDTPILAEIAKCESRFTQVNKDGSLHRGVVNDADVGVMQINESYHLDRSEKLGMDIHTLVGNLKYGKYLFEKEGTKPWGASKKCWGKYTEVAKK